MIPKILFLNHPCCSQPTKRSKHEPWILRNKGILFWSVLHKHEQLIANITRFSSPDDLSIKNWQLLTFRETIQKTSLSTVWLLRVVNIVKCEFCDKLSTKIFLTFFLEAEHRWC